MDEMHNSKANHLAKKIIIAMILGMLVGISLHYLPNIALIQNYVINGFLDIVGKLFISILTMLVVPIVFVSLVCGTCHLSDTRKFGSIALKSVCLYLFTTSLAIGFGLFFATLFDIGHTAQTIQHHVATISHQTSFKELILNLIPKNPFRALVDGDMLQVILFSILLGMAIALAGKKAEGIANLFQQANQVMMKLIDMVMIIAPYGVFCLIATLLAKVGVSVISQLFEYFFTVLVVLLFHIFFTNSVLLKFLAKLSPIPFFKKMYSAMLFAFGTSSSNASIPVTLETVRDKLGVGNTTASFIIPLGATINMDGTAIMQGIATVFIAHAYNIDIGLMGYLSVILTATLASIGTAGVPGVGLITLTLVLKQVGLPVEGIAMIIGVDRLLDMVRTAVNITGDAMISCVVGKSEDDMDIEQFNSK